MINGVIHLILGTGHVQFTTEIVITLVMFALDLTMTPVRSVIIMQIQQQLPALANSLANVLLIGLDSVASFTTECVMTTVALVLDRHKTNVLNVLKMLGKRPTTSVCVRPVGSQLEVYVIYGVELVLQHVTYVQREDGSQIARNVTTTLTKMSLDFVFAMMIGQMMTVVLM